jgi:acyl-CoA synthetase (AMP-forming)/AMP-acid ligase II
VRIRDTLQKFVHFWQSYGVYREDSPNTLALQFERHARRRPGHRFLLYGDSAYTYAEANALVNRHAHAYRELGIRHGDVVAIVMENRPAFLWHMLGLFKLGAVASLVNARSTGDEALHALRICRPKHVVIGSEIWPRFAGVRAQFDKVAPGAIDVDLDPEHPIATDMPVFARRTEPASSANPIETGQQKLSDQATFIYTSGTTGLPKAVIMRHLRFYRAGRAWDSCALRYEPDDIHYTCLPLYHSNAALIATGSVISAGVTLALSREFSRTGFWDEVRKHRATSFIYIGEMCRYLLNADPSPRDRDHEVRVITGNGMRADVWKPFQKRFGIARISEFYGATEGNVATINTHNAVGSCGWLIPGMAVARWDDEAQALVRDARGRVVKAKSGEAGLLLTEIHAKRQFDGYHDKSANERKIVRDAFKPGDAWFDTGDILYADIGRRVYFVDRVVDTFRWKGHSIASSDVEEKLATWPDAREVAVYGVRVPGSEGRAGMAAIILAAKTPFDGAGFLAHASRTLPEHARPMFLRIATQLKTTATLKVKKAELQKDGFDPGSLADPLYILDRQRNAYVRLNGELYAELTAGRVA